ncbi:hypothetical protein MATL_G00260830 [Megalops atlanticus]|uniref:Uncharacterized protein n=1 Tax=Megalops atlanticus TaxID=7932 RepID=A0A9D3STH1_MEGAT|nr:hypothetical protein MATL_G00260830 [Megalops atlanticus]
MHIKTGTWEASSMGCESDPLYDSAALVSPPNPEPHIRNRRLSPGSGSCGGAGGGGNRVRKHARQTSPPAAEHAPHTHAPAAGRDTDHRAHLKGRTLRKEGPRGGRAGPHDRARRDKERWAGDSLSLLKPPPSFPVKDSPAKLQPAVSYASKVKAGPAGSAAEDPPAIGVLLQNQWGLSFISDSPQNAEAAESQSPVENGTSAEPPLTCPVNPAKGVSPAEEADAGSPAPATQLPFFGQCREEADASGELLLGCRHLVEAVRYHTQEWEAIYSKQKQGSPKVVWYQSLDQPA